MALDPSISLGVRSLQLPDPLAQMAQVSQFQAAQQQQQLNKMKIEELVADRKELNDLSAKLQEKGITTRQYMEMLRSSRNPERQKMGVEGLTRLDEQDKFETMGKRLYPELFGATPAAPSPTEMPAAPVSSIMRQPTVAAAAPVQNALGSGMYGMEPTAPVNTLAANVAPAAPAAAAPVNALAAPNAKTADQLRREIIMFSQSTDPRAKAMADMLKNQLTELNKTHTVGGRIVGGGGNVIYAAPTELDDLIAKANDPLKSPSERAIYQQRIAKLATHAPGSTVYMPPQEKAEQGDRGKLLIKQYSDISDTARIGAKTLPSLESNAAILSKGFDTGFGTEAKAAGAKVLGALGVKDAQNYATNAQTFLGNASSAILQKQLEQKGPQTESDAQRITQTGAQLGNTKEANMFFIDVAKEQIKRDVDQRNFYDKWWKQNKTYDGAEDAWYSSEGGKSLFERPGLRKYINPTSAASQIPGQGPSAPAAAPAAGGGASVTLPDGRVKTFPSAEAANQFKKAAGLK